MEGLAARRILLPARTKLRLQQLGGKHGINSLNPNREHIGWHF